MKIYIPLDADQRLCWPFPYSGPRRSQSRVPLCRPIRCQRDASSGEQACLVSTRFHSGTSQQFLSKVNGQSEQGDPREHGFGSAARLAIGIGEHKTGQQRQRRASAFRRAHQHADRRRAGFRVDWQDRDRTESRPRAPRAPRQDRPRARSASQHPPARRSRDAVCSHCASVRLEAACARRRPRSGEGLCGALKGGFIST